MVKLTTSLGAARLRPMLAKDELVLADLAELENTDEASAYYRVKGRMVRALDAALDSADWEGGFGELPKDEVLVTFVKWDTATDDEALGEGTAPSSATPPEPGR